MSTCPYRLYTWGEPVLRRCTPAAVTGQKPVQYTATMAATTAMVLLSHYTAAVAVNIQNMALRRRQLTYYTEVIRDAGPSPCDQMQHHKTTRTRLSTRQRQKCRPVIRKVDLPLLEKMTQENIHLDYN